MSSTTSSGSTPVQETLKIELPQPGSIRGAAALKGLGKASGKPGEAHFDELGSEHALSVERKQVRFLGIWPAAVVSTTASAVSGAAVSELKNCLREYAGKATIKVPSDVSLPELVELIATHQGIQQKKPPAPPASR